MLIVSRALLGIAGATLAPSTLSLIRSMFLDPQQRTVAISIWITSFSVGAAVGPLLGGLVLEFFWWGSVFLLAVPVMALILIFGPKLLPEYKDPNPGKLDIPSAALSVVAVLGVIYGIKQMAQDGFEWVPFTVLVVGSILGAIFVFRQLKLADPLVDLSLFKIPAFSASMSLYWVAVFVIFGGFLFLPQYLQLVLGLSPLESGLVFLPWALGFVVGSQLTPRIVRWVRPAHLMAVGLVLGALGVAAFTQLDESSGLLGMILASIAFSLGTAPLFTLTIDLIIGFAPPERAGAAAGMAETGAEFGGALGIAIFGSIGLALYRSAMGDASLDGIPAEAAIIARDTLGGAMEVAPGLPAELGSRLVDVARDAYLPGLRIASAVSAVGLLVLAVFSYLLLRQVPPTTEPAMPPDGLAPEPVVAD